MLHTKIETSTKVADHSAEAWPRLYRIANHCLALLLSLIQVHTSGFSVLGCTATLDCSWIVDTDLAVAQHAKFGSTYVWTYGPLGFAGNNVAIDRHLYGIADLIQIALAALLALLLVHVLAGRLRMPAASVTVAVLALLLPSYLEPTGTILAALLCSIMLLHLASDSLATRRTEKTKLESGTVASLVAAGAVLPIGPLIKGSLLPSIAATMIVWSLCMSVRRRWAEIAILAISFLAVWFGIFAALEGGQLAAWCGR